MVTVEKNHMNVTEVLEKGISRKVVVVMEEENQTKCCGGVGEEEQKKCKGEGENN